MGERRSKRVSVGRPEGRRQLGRPRYRWENNVTVDFLFLIITKKYTINVIKVYITTVSLFTL